MKIDKFGRVTLPKVIRDNLGITFDTSLEIEQKGDQVIIRVPQNKASTILENGILVYTGAALADLNQTLEAIREERLKDQ